MAEQENSQQVAVKEEKKDIIEAAKSLPNPQGGFSLRPRNFDEAYRFANLIASSDLVPKDFRDKPANVLVAVQLGMELGISPIQALQNIAVINGRPTIWGDLLPALIFSSGLLESIDEQATEKGATCTVKRKGFAPVTREFTWEDAKKAKTVEYGKTISLSEKSTYQSYPKRMMAMRARAFALRDTFADVLKGMSIREEVEDFAEPINVTLVQAAPIAIPQPTREKETAPSGQTDSTGGEAANRSAQSEVAHPGPQAAKDLHAASGDGDLETGAESKSDEAKTKTGDDKGESQSQEKSVEELALAEIAGYTEQTFPDPKELNKFMKGQSEGTRLKVTAAYNAKKKELWPSN